MGRLGRRLSTLRPVGRPTRTQDSLPGVGQTLPGGLEAHWAPPKGFELFLHLSSSPRLILAQARGGPTNRSIERALACVVAGVSVLTLGSCGLLMEGAPLSGPMRSPDSTE